MSHRMWCPHNQRQSDNEPDLLPRRSAPHIHHVAQDVQTEGEREQENVARVLHKTDMNHWKGNFYTAPVSRREYEIMVSIWTRLRSNLPWTSRHSFSLIALHGPRNTKMTVACSWSSTTLWSAVFQVLQIKKYKITWLLPERCKSPWASQRRHYWAEKLSTFAGLSESCGCSKYQFIFSFEPTFALLHR